MPPLIVWVFLFSASLFAAVHRAASVASFYWYYPGFDVVMHFSGGVLVALGVTALSTLHAVSFKPTLRNILVVLFVFMISWEIFELLIGLYSPDMYVFDTIKDIVVGTIGGFTGYIIFGKEEKEL